MQFDGIADLFAQLTVWVTGLDSWQQILMLLPIGAIPFIESYLGSLLGPLVVASQITAPTLVALGARRGSVYLWMAVSIVVWGVLFGLFGGAIGLLAGR